MADFYVSSVAYAAITQRADSTAYTLGQIRRQGGTPTVGDERVYRCTTAGTSGASAPTWNLGSGTTTTDGTVVWTECTGESAYQSAGNWTAAAPHIDVIAKFSAGKAASGGGDWVFIADDHVEPVWSSSRDWSRLGRARVVNVAGSTLPPGPADAGTAGVTVSTTGASHITLSGNVETVGLSFSVGSSSNTASLFIGRSAVNGSALIRDGNITINNTSASSRVTIGNTGSGSLVLENCTVSFGHASQQFNMATGGSFFRWTVGALAGTAPTNLFHTNFVAASTLLEGVDLSLTGNTILNLAGGSSEFYGSFVAAECKVHASATLAGNYRIRSPADRIEFNVVDADATARPNRMVRGAMKGRIDSEHTVFRTGGTTGGDGAAMSWSILPSSNTNGSPTDIYHPTTPWFYFWNTATSSKTATVEVLLDKGAIVGRGKVWASVKYPASSGSIKASINSAGDFPAPGGTPTAGTASSEPWDAPSRANSTAYTAGQPIKVSSNTGRVFFCTSAGTSSGSLPAGYATAVDGDSVTDGGATFRAGIRQSVAVTFTAGRAGLVGVRVHFADAQANPTRLYVDPRMTLT